MLYYQCLIGSLLLIVAVLAWVMAAARARRKQRFVFSPWPVRKATLADIDPLFIPGPFGPSEATLASIIGTTGVVGSTSDTEGWILAALAKKSHAIFEFGTCSGRTTFLMAVNAPDDARITTITLAPDQCRDYRKAAADDTLATAAALKESQYATFYYSGTAAEKKITQLFGDSKALDATPFHRSCDLIFIDGSHAYSYVQSDTRKALAMIKPGGLILWHDYKGPRVAAGVFKALNEYTRDLKLMHIAGTTLVAHRAL